MLFLKRGPVTLQESGAVPGGRRDGYQYGQSEELVGEFIAADRDNFVLATKYMLGTIATEGISRTGNSRKNMVRSVEESLKRLKTDRIDLYWADFADSLTPMQEIVRAFDDLVRAGTRQRPQEPDRRSRPSRAWTALRQ